MSDYWTNQPPKRYAKPTRPAAAEVRRARDVAGLKREVSQLQSKTEYRSAMQVGTNREHRLDIDLLQHDVQNGKAWIAALFVAYVILLVAVVAVIIL